MDTIIVGKNNMSKYGGFHKVTNYSQDTNVAGVERVFDEDEEQALNVFDKQPYQGPGNIEKSRIKKET